MATIYCLQLLQPTLVVQWNPREIHSFTEKSSAKTRNNMSGISRGFTFPLHDKMQHLKQIKSMDLRSIYHHAQWCLGKCNVGIKAVYGRLECSSLLLGFGLIEDRTDLEDFIQLQRLWHMRHNDTCNTEKYRPQVYEEWLVGRGLVGRMCNCVLMCMGCVIVCGGKDKSLSHSWWTLGQRSSRAMQAIWSDTTEKGAAARVIWWLIAGQRPSRVVQLGGCRHH